MGYTLKNDNETAYSYGDYLTWTGEERYELIEGEAFLMSPAPSTRHQEMCFFLSMKLGQYVTNKDCKVFFAPFDVRLPFGNEMDEDISTVVQPDIVVICDRSKLDEKGCKGAPELVIEITSPSSFYRDMKTKKDLYERAKVKEYWIVDPANQGVMVFVLKDGQYEKPLIFGGTDMLHSHFFSDFEVNLCELFRQP